MYSLCSWWVNNEQGNINQTSIKPKGFRASWLVWWTKTEVYPGSFLNSENQNHFVNKDVTCTDSWALFNKILIETELARTTDTLLWSDRLHVVLPKGGSYKQNEFVLWRFTWPLWCSNGNFWIKTYGTSRLASCETQKESETFPDWV